MKKIGILIAFVSIVIGFVPLDSFSKENGKFKSITSKVRLVKKAKAKKISAKRPKEVKEMQKIGCINFRFLQPFVFMSPLFAHLQFLRNLQTEEDSVGA